MNNWQLLSFFLQWLFPQDLAFLPQQLIGKLLRHLCCETWKWDFMHHKEQVVSASFSGVRRVTVCTEVEGPSRGCTDSPQVLGWGL